MFSLRSITHTVTIMLLMLVATLSLAQPRTPITWGDVRLLRSTTYDVPRGSTYPVACYGKGDTIIAIEEYHLYSAYWSRSSISSNNGLSWSNWNLVCPDTTDSGWANGDPTITPQGIFYLASRNNQARKMYRTTDLGQSWQEMPSIGAEYLQQIYDSVGDTIICSGYSIYPGTNQYKRGITWTTDGGNTFAPVIFPVLNDSLFAGEWFPQLRNGWIHTFGIQLTPTIDEIFYSRRLFTGNTFSTPYFFQIPSGRHTYENLSFNSDGHGICMLEMGFPGDNGDRMFFWRTSDNGITWLGPEPLTENASASITFNQVECFGKLRVLLWTDTTNFTGVPLPRHFPIVTVRFSANNGKSWYPSQSVLTAYQDTCLFIPSHVDLTQQYVRFYSFSTSYLRIMGGYHFQLQGNITTDSIVPILSLVDTIPAHLSANQSIPLNVNGHDNDSLWRVDLVAKRVGETDSLVVPLHWTSPGVFSTQFLVPVDSGTYAYYYRAEDMWENIGYADTLSPARPGTFVVTSSGVNETTLLPKDVEFSAYPNPSNSAITFTGTVIGNRNAVLTIYDLLGREVVNVPIQANNQPTRPFNVIWTGMMKSGTPATTGVYYARVRVGSTSTQTIKFTLLR